LFEIGPVSLKKATTVKPVNVTPTSVPKSRNGRPAPVSYAPVPSMYVLPYPAPDTNTDAPIKFTSGVVNNSVVENVR